VLNLHEKEIFVCCVCGITTPLVGDNTLVGFILVGQHQCIVMKYLKFKQINYFLGLLWRTKETSQVAFKIEQLLSRRHLSKTVLSEIVFRVSLLYPVSYNGSLSRKICKYTYTTEQKKL